MHAAVWDIFCRVIDNLGDIGVCWRLSADLAARGQRVRLWVDDPTALDWMAPGARTGQWARITVYDWNLASDPRVLPTLTPAEVWIEAFGCDIPPAFLCHHLASGKPGAQAIWINLEYLSAEAFAVRAHGLPSPVMSGPAKGCTKYFFYPGFTPSSGGLLRETDLARRQAVFDRGNWLAAHGVPWQGERLVSLFCYEPEPLGELVRAWQAERHPTRLLVTHGRAQAAVRALPATPAAHTGRLSIDFLPALSQRAFDQLLWCCDLNLVRGEDSVVRALWAGKPLLWQIYPQHDDAHHAKLEAFLDTLQAPPSLRSAHRVWNGIAAGPMPALALDDWGSWASRVCRELRSQSDLVSRLFDFIAVAQHQEAHKGGRGSENS